MKMLRLGALLLAALLPSHALAQSSPGLRTGQVPTAAQWNSYFAAKQDVLGYTPLNSAGGAMTGPLITTAATPTAAGIRIPPGVAPTSPSNGDLWTTSAGIYVRINGATYVLSTGTSLPAIVAGDLIYGTGVNTVAAGSFSVTLNAIFSTTNGAFPIRQAGVWIASTALTTGNVGIGMSTFGTSAALMIGMANGTLPSTQLAASIQMGASAGLPYVVRASSVTPVDTAGTVFKRIDLVDYATSAVNTNDLFTLNSGRGTTYAQTLSLNGGQDGTGGFCAGLNDSGLGFGGFGNFVACNSKGYFNYGGYTKTSLLSVADLTPGAQITYVAYFVGDNDYVGVLTKPSSGAIYAENRSYIGGGGSFNEFDCQSVDGNGRIANPWLKFGSGSAPLAYCLWLSPGGTKTPHSTYISTAAIGITDIGTAQFYTGILFNSTSIADDGSGNHVAIAMPSNYQYIWCSSPCSVVGRLSGSGTALTWAGTGGVVLSGGAIGASPTPLLTFSPDYYDSAGTIAISHIKLLSNFGFGVSNISSVVRLNYIANSGALHSFFIGTDPVTESAYSATIGTANTNSTSGSTGTLIVQGGIGATQAISSDTTVNATTGYRVNGAAASGNVLRGNATNFVSAQLAASDLSNGVSGSGAVALVTSPNFLTSVMFNTTTILTFPSAATWHLGAADSATAAVAQTLIAAGSSGNSAAAALFTIAGSDQTGTTTTGGAVRIRGGNGTTVGGAVEIWTSATSTPAVAVSIAAANKQVTFSGAGAGAQASPAARIALGAYYDSNGVSTSHFDMFSAQFGFGISVGGLAAQLNYVTGADGLHAFYSISAPTTPQFTVGTGANAGIVVGAPTGGLKGTGTINATGVYYANGTAGVTCTAGVPSVLFTASNGIVTHC